MSVVATTLVTILVVDHLVFWFALDRLPSYIQAPLERWLPLRVLGPFVVYVVVALSAIRNRAALAPAAAICSKL